MEAWRSDWVELQKALSGKTIDDALIQKLLKSHPGRASPTKFVVSEQQMYLASVQREQEASSAASGAPRMTGAASTAQKPVQKQLPLSQPEPEPEWVPPATPEGVPPAPSHSAPLPAALDLPASDAEQQLLSSILSEPRPASVACTALE